jgi:hypothetical protein
MRTPLDPALALEAVRSTPTVTFTAPRRWSAVFDLHGLIPARERTPDMAAPNPPQVGVTVDKASLNSKLGANAQSLKKAAIGLADLNDWAAAYTAADLENLYGFTPEEANLFKSAMGEVPSVTTLVDGLQWLSKTWGA